MRSTGDDPRERDLGSDQVWAAPGDMPEPTLEEHADMQAMLAEHLVDMGVDAAAIAAVVAFAEAITARDAAAACAQLAATTPWAADPAAYEARLAEVLASAPERTWRGEVFPDHLGRGEVLWAHLTSPTGRPPWHDRISVQVALRQEEGAWKVDADLLDPRYHPRVDMTDWMDPLRMFGLPDSGELGFRPYALAGWDGPMGLGGADLGDAHGRPWVLLVHGDPLSMAGPRVLVESSPRSIPRSDGLMQLATAAIPIDPDASTRQDVEASRRREALATKLRSGPQVEVQLQVDGTPATFRGVRTEHGFSAVCEDLPVHVGVTAIGVPEAAITLGSIDHVRDFAEGLAREWALARSTSTSEDPEDRPATRNIMINATIEADPAEHDFLDFSLDTFDRLGKMSPAGIAAISSTAVWQVHGGEDAYAAALEADLDSRPITLSRWSQQPRMSGPGTAHAMIELLFEGENPFARWTPVDLVIEGGHPRLDVDLVRLAARNSPEA